MAPRPPRPASRYRRRILIVGGVIGLLLYVIGAPIFNDRIEDDLEQRVPAELSEAGFVGVVASFSGQDGTLTCEQPLGDPEDALSAAYDVWGVRAIDLDRSCRVNRAPTVATTTTAAADDGDGAANSLLLDADAASEAINATSAPTSTTTTVPAADFDSVLEIVATSPDLSLLAVLTDEAGFADQIGPGADDGHQITLFAPTDAAFDALPADAVARMRADPALLRTVLAHHLVDGRLTASAIATGEFVTHAGDTLDVVASGGRVTVGAATVTDADIMATNGIVHVVDAVLVPADVDLSANPSAIEAAATFSDATIVLDGVVATEVERAALAAVVTTALGEDGVIDQLMVDPDRGIDAATAAALAQLIESMTTHLVSGVSGFDGSSLYVRGTYLAEAGRDAVAVVADQLSAVAELEPRGLATEDDAADLEGALNSFVAANPIRFEPSSANLSGSAGEVLDAIVQRVRQFGGVTITIEGHTDSDGVPAQNLTLSRLRAIAVREALVGRGLDDASLTAEGFGSQRPVLVDGVEDKAASRRVEFRVVQTS